MKIKYFVKKRYILCIISSMIYLTCYFLSCVKFQMNQYIYNVSVFDIVISEGFNFEHNLVPIPITLKMILSLGFIFHLMGLVFLINNLYKKASALFICSVISPLILIISSSVIHENTLYLDLKTFKASYLFPVFLMLFVAVTSSIFSRWMLGSEILGEAVFKVFSCISILSIIVMTFYIFLSGIPALTTIGPVNFLLGTVWSPSNNSYGILPLILSSLEVTAGAIILGVPIGILTSVFLAEISPKWLSSIIRMCVQILAGIPSVLYGFFGMVIIVPLIKKIFHGNVVGDSLLAAIIILSIMILPTIVSVSENALKSVPTTYREASLALGATTIETIFKVTIPSAISGIMSSVILGMGRAIGETMAVIMVAGNVANMPSLLSPARFLTTGIVLEMSYSSGLHRQALFSIGLILFIFIMLIDMCFIFITKKGAYANEI